MYVAAEADTADGSGYHPIETLQGEIQKVKALNMSRFGGVALWVGSCVACTSDVPTLTFVTGRVSERRQCELPRWGEEGVEGGRIVILSEEVEACLIRSVSGAGGARWSGICFSDDVHACNVPVLFL